MSERSAASEEKSPSPQGSQGQVPAGANAPPPAEASERKRALGRERGKKPEHSGLARASARRRQRAAPAEASERKRALGRERKNRAHRARKADRPPAPSRRPVGGPSESEEQP